jgi:hypothetical protein
MASRTSTRRRAGGRSSSRRQQNNQMPMIIGGAGLLVLIIILVMVKSRGGGDDADDTGANAPANQPATQPEKPRSNVAVSGGLPGKSPDRPAPTLTQDTLNKMSDLLAEAKSISNSGFALLKEGKNFEARTRQSEAKVKIDEIKALIEEPTLWYEEADMDDWSIPAEYVAMNKLYGKLSTLLKTIRMQGGR